MKTKTLLFKAIAIYLLFTSTQCVKAQNVNIPNAIFKAALVNNASINTNMDAEIQTSEASVFNGAINVNNLGITDLTGIEAFVALDSLDCSSNEAWYYDIQNGVWVLNSAPLLNVSANTALTYLNCSGNPITSLDVSANTALTYLNCNSNQLTSLDVSANTALTYLNCWGNQLTSLNVSGCIALTTLECGSCDPMGGGECLVNQLISLDVSANTALTVLGCSFNQLTSLDVSSCTGLTYLDVSANTALTSLNCSSSQIQNLNVASCTALTNLNCSGNQNQLTNLNVTGCTALTSLDCSGNYYYFTNLDVSSCTALTTLNCAYNRLTSLNVSSCTTLTYLDCSNNQIAGLDVSSNSALTYLDCSKNCKPPMMLPEGNFSDYVYFLDSLDVTANIALTILKCNNNGLLSLNTTGLTALAYLDCSFNPRGFFNGMKSYVWCHSSSPLLNFSSNTALSYLNCSGNVLQNLNVSACTVLTYLDCSDEQEWAPENQICETPQLTSLDVSANSLLTNLDIAYNSLSTLDVSANTLLTNLMCNDNQLTSLDVKNGNNINMITFNALGNPSLSCIEVDDVQWSIDNWTAAAPQTSFFSENCSGLGITDNNESKALMFYPNPTTGTIYLSAPGNISLSDLSGKLLLEQKNTNQLDISTLPAGMYFLHFGEINQHTFKVIKE